MVNLNCRPLTTNENLKMLTMNVIHVSHVSNTVTLKAIYFAYFHCIMKYGIIFWGNSSSSKNLFTLQKKVIRIIAGVKPRHSCRNLFKGLEILPLPCEYIFSLMNFIVNNQKLFQTNSAVHSVNTRNKHQLHRPIANLSCFQKSAFILYWHQNFRQSAI
jgi:hypothetical protein